MSIAEMVRRMAEVGATPAMIAIAVEAMEAVEAVRLDAVAAANMYDEGRRARAAERQRLSRYRRAENAKNNNDVTSQSVTVTRQSRDIPSPLVPPSPSPLHPPTTTPLNPPTLDFPSENLDRFASIRLEFASFWMRYPHKVGKGAAEKSFLKARQASSFEALMAGLDAYIIARRPDCPWCNPATWLNQLRWLDEPAPPPQATPPPWKKTMMSPSELRRAMGMDAAE